MDRLPLSKKGEPANRQVLLFKYVNGEGNPDEGRVKKGAWLSWGNCAAASVDGEAALLANDIAKLGFKIVIDEGGKTDMCKAREEFKKETKVIESVESLRMVVKDDKEVIKLVTGRHNVTPEYVIEIMKNLAETGTAAGNKEALDSERG